MSAEITAELLDAFNEYVSQNRYIKYRAIEAAFKLFMAVPETLQLNLMRDSEKVGELNVRYNDKPAGSGSKQKLEVEIDADSSKTVCVDKKELESLIKQIVKEQLKTK